MCRFGEYEKEQPLSFSLHENMTFNPQFMFNLRRSQFVQACCAPPLIHLLLLCHVTAHALMLSLL